MNAVAEDYLQERDAVMSQAGSLYREHRKISSQLDAAEDKRADRHASAGKYRRMWAEVGSPSVISLSAITGPRLRRKLNNLYDKLETNRTEARAHVDKNFPIYMAAALALDATFPEQGEAESVEEQFRSFVESHSSELDGNNPNFTADCLRGGEYAVNAPEQLLPINRVVFKTFDNEGGDNVGYDISFYKDEDLMTRFELNPDPRTFVGDESYDGHPTAPESLQAMLNQLGAIEARGDLTPIVSTDAPA